MNKPLTVARREFTENLVKLLNESKLPAFVTADILRQCVAELDNLAKQQYETEKAEYEKSLKESK